jgi:hypothetical protein
MSYDPCVLLLSVYITEKLTQIHLSKGVHWHTVCKKEKSKNNLTVPQAEDGKTTGLIYPGKLFSSIKEHTKTALHVSTLGVCHKNNSVQGKEQGRKRK